MSVAQQQPSYDNPLTFQELYDDFYNQRVSSQLSEGTLTMYGYTVHPFCEWADEKGFEPTTVGETQVFTYIAILSDPVPKDAKGQIQQVKLVQSKLTGRNKTIVASLSCIVKD